MAQQEQILFYRCGRRDSNPRTPARVDLESTTVGHLVTPAFMFKIAVIQVLIINLTVRDHLDKLRTYNLVQKVLILTE